LVFSTEVHPATEVFPTAEVMFPTTDKETIKDAACLPDKYKHAYAGQTE
jgi:hypothetical protein